MNTRDIIELARAAGWDDYTLSAIVGTEQMERLQAFARLVAQQEREACAGACDDLAKLRVVSLHDANQCVQAIRVRNYR